MKKGEFIAGGLLILFLFMAPGMASAERKITLSRAEEVILLTLGHQASCKD